MEASTVVRFEIPVSDVPDSQRAEAERKAREAYVLSLFRQGNISAGRAAEILGLDRWQLGELMAVHGLSPFDATLTREELERELADASPAP
jgi:predicted HTH domain antitoxin